MTGAPTPAETPDSDAEPPVGARAPVPAPEPEPVAEPEPASESEPAPEPARRVSPVTPVLNAWKVATALVAFAVWQGRDIVREEAIPPATVGLVFLGVLVVSALVSLTFNYFAWRRMSYGFDAESIFLHRGILFRSQRHVRLDRIQSVDLNQPILARVFGFVSLQVTSAGSSQDNLVIAFVRDDEAHRLRNEILVRAAGLDPGEEQAPAPEAPEHELFRMTPGRVFGSLVRSAGVLVGSVITIAIITTAIVLREPSIIATLFLPLVAQVTFWWQRLNSQFDFAVATSPDGIRLRYGLLSTTARTVPPGRVQALQFTQPVLWRRKNWWRITLTVAGDGVSAERGEPTLYPVATQDEAARLLYLILPDLGVDDPLALIDASLRGTGADEGFTTSPRRVWWVDPLVWRRTGYRATTTATIIRRGRLTRRAILVPNARIQSLGVTQGPVERRLVVANVALHTTPGTIAPVAPHLDAEDAREFLRGASARAKAARRSAGPERWMEHPPAHPRPAAQPPPVPAPGRSAGAPVEGQGNSPEPS